MIKPALGLFVALLLLFPYSGALVDLAAANPSPLAPFPPSNPIMTTPPTIFVFSPL